MTSEVNPITLAVVGEGLTAIVREMRASIIRASYSPAIYELDDFSCALFNDKAEMVAQSEDHPGHVVPMPWSVKAALEDFEGDIQPGDIVVLNDPYRGGTHLNDVTVVYPIYVQKKLALFAVVRAHWADVGGGTPGSYSGLATNIYQEGLRIPPVKLREGGRMNESVLRLIQSNMRLPEQRLGDANAMIGACSMADERVQRLYEKYSARTVSDCISAHLDRSEQRMRARISSLPDGIYEYEDYLEYYEAGTFDPVLLRVALTVDGDSITVDFAGSNEQVPGVVNASLAVAGAGVFIALKSTLDPGSAVNHGALRPIQLKAPEASIVDVRIDGPAGAHGEVRKRVVSAMLGCLAQISTDLMFGDLSGTSFPNAIGGRAAATGESYVFLEVPAGGNGACYELDGSSAFVNVDFGNIRSIHTAEFLESEMPLRVERCELRTDSGGPGRWRGGLGMRRELVLLDAEATYSVQSDRAVIPPFGVDGGGSAAPVRVSLIEGDEEVDLEIPGKAIGRTIREGAIVVMESAGGGGLGDPFLRDARQVAADVAAGYVSRTQAREQYGVQLTYSGDVDEVATDGLRRHSDADVWRVEVFADERPAYEGVRGRHRILRVASTLAGTCGVRGGQLVELLGLHPAPLRAWVKLDEEALPDLVGLDEFARRVLGVEPGELVGLRAVSTVIGMESNGRVGAVSARLPADRAQ